MQHDNVPPGRQPIGLFDIRTLDLLNKQPFHSLHSIADALGLSRSAILNHLPELLRMNF
jgi:DNA-binding Lrp family transcriptional regulator